MFEGLYTALVTPFYSDGRFNDSKLKDLIRIQAKAGVAGIVPAGTTGENPTFSDREHLRVFSVAIEAAKEENLQVIAGCGSNNTEKAIILCKKAAEYGADGALVITPYYNKPNQDGLYKHFSLIADNSPIPIVMYNVPSRTGVHLSAETSIKLSYHENIVSLKEASGNLSHVQEIIFNVDNRMSILSGEDNLTFSIMALGGKGCISVVSNIIPKEYNTLIESMLRRDYYTSLKFAKKLDEICRKMFIDTNPIPVKAAMNIMGMDVGPTRLPLTKISPEKYEELVILLNKYGLITPNGGQEV
ncbi:MAG: 4-hydroxy-tetrahydrodipicolinate synthase [Candidatus Delongbacteria bacterium]|nr:4-hydroxy-tetrahydrodipicolinate synthase [Candidatus Delongbacteria bacterium]MBN2834616.1 4-hydroxy-tetrahydrodipicolinate synthase [Candidatus Delongbacteria bacterium]